MVGYCIINVYGDIASMMLWVNRSHSACFAHSIYDAMGKQATG
jgi:hypothetical protein